MELSHSASAVIGVIFSSFASASSLGRMTWFGEHRSNQFRCSHESWNWIVEEPYGRVAMLRKERPKDLCGKYGKLVKIFIITTACSCEFCWTRVTEGSTFAWLEWKKTVTIPGFPSPTPSVMRMAISMISLLLAFLLLRWSAWQRVPQTPHRNGECASKGAHWWTSTHLPGMNGLN